MAVHSKDYYEVLGVAKSAPREEIRRAFRKLAREHHPDVAKDKKASEARFREINDAYEVLGDAERRRKYDQGAAAWKTNGGANAGAGGFGGSGWSGMKNASSEAGGDFGEFFETFMRASAARDVARDAANRARSQGEERARGVEAEVQVTVEEVFRGATKRVTVRIPGRVTGEVVEVGVPGGTVPGQKIRLKGRGLNGGDLYFKVKLLPHDVYRVDGSDLQGKVGVPVWKAVLGGALEVQTPDGVVRLKLPAGTQHGRRFRLGGHGLPMAGKRRGNLILEVQVEVPQFVSLEERACWVKLEELASKR